MSADFKKIASVEIEEFKAEYRARFPGRSTDDLRDEDLLREVMNTVGKAGSSASACDAWTRSTTKSTASRSRSSRVQDRIRVPAPVPIPTRVRALEDRIACGITFPRLLGYRHDVTSERLSATFTDDSKLALSTADITTRTENAPIVGERSIHTLDDLKRHSTRDVDFDTTKAVYPTAPDKCHIPTSSPTPGSWEQKMAQALEEMPEVTLTSSPRLVPVVTGVSPTCST